MSVSRLKPGHRVLATGGVPAGSVARFLGAGGQGEVYELAGAGAPLAFKRYHPLVVRADARLSLRLARAISVGAPDSRFLWPLAFAAAEGDENGVGIIMPMREARFRPMKDLISAPPRRISPDLAARATACLRIADSFMHLHACGLCYQDISFGNLFLDPASGDIAICDNDNVDADGAPPSVFGTRKFMAPEIVRREAMPSTRTDLYSMAVMFFYILFAWHPLDGRAEAETLVLDADAELRLYGTHPRFIFDPDDTSNGPVPGHHDVIVRRWNALTGELRALFVRAFTQGLAHADRRVMETEWRDAFFDLRDMIITCEGCGFEHALGHGSAGDQPAAFACLACGRAVGLPPVLTIGRSRITLTRGKRVLQGHVYQTERFTENTDPVASLQPHPNDPAIAGLRNDGRQSWQATFADGRQAEVAPGRTMRIADGTMIAFGACDGRIRAAGCEAGR